MIASLIRKWLYWMYEFSPGEALFLKLGKSFHLFPTFSAQPHIERRIQRNINQGLLNQTVIPNYIHRQWPWWVKRISNPKSRFYALTPKPNLLLNTMFRQTTPLFSSHDGCVASVDPYGSVCPHPRFWSTEFWISVHNKALAFQDIDHVHQQFIPETLQVKTSLQYEALEMSSATFFKSFPQQDHLLFTKLTFKNNGTTPLPFSAFVTLRPYNMDGICPISTITYISKQAFVVDNKLGLILDQKPDNVVCAPFEDGDLLQKVGSWEMILTATCPKHLASAFAEYKLTLNPGETKSITFKTPLNTKTYKLHKPEKLMHTIQEFQAISYENEETHVGYEWQNTYSPHWAVHTPHSRMNHLLKLALTYIQLSFPIKNPVSKFEHVSFSSQYFTLKALLSFGYRDTVETIVDTLLHKKSYLKSNWSYPCIGALLSLIYELHITRSVRETSSITLSHVEKCLSLLSSKLTKSQSEYHVSGLLEKTQNSWGRKDYYLPHQLFGLAGFYYGSRLLKMLGHADLALRYHATFNHLKGSIETFCDTISDKFVGEKITPFSGKTYEDIRIIEGLFFLFPLNLPGFKPDWIKSTLHVVYQRYCLDGHPFDYTRNGYHTVYTGLIAYFQVLLQNPLAFKHLEWLTTHASRTGLWPTTLHPFTHSGSYGSGYDLDTSALFALTLKRMLVEETLEEIHLFPCIPADWLKDDQPLILEDLPLQKGKLSIKLTLKGSQAQVIIAHQFHAPPKKLKLSLPFEIEKVTIGKSVTEPHTKTISITLNTKDLDLHLKRDPVYAPITAT